MLLLLLLLLSGKLFVNHLTPGAALSQH